MSCLTGGRWLQTQDKASKVLTAFLRVPQELSASQEEYFRFAVAQGQKQAKPLAFRQGGKSTLGILNSDPDTFPNASRVRVWEVAEVPKNLGRG